MNAPRACLAGVLLLAAGSGTVAAADTGTELLDQCTKALQLLAGHGAALSEADRNDASFCLGFVQGVTNIVSISYYVKPRGQMFCPPPGEAIPLDAAVKALVDYLKAHPERLSARKVTLAAAAFMKAYPCPYWPPVPKPPEAATDPGAGTAAQPDQVPNR